MKQMRPVSIVCLTKYREVFFPFVKSVIEFTPSFPIVAVADGGIEFTGFPGTEKLNFNFIDAPTPFGMARNGNIGLKAVPKDHDVLYVGDDIRFLQKNTIEDLQRIAYSHPKIGILSPRLIGRGSQALVNPSLLNSQVVDPVEPVVPMQMWFPCVYIKREVIDKIGYLDEQFDGFGSDDLDYCLRAKIAGYELAVAAHVVVQHEAGPKGGPTTFEKNIGFDAFQRQQIASFEKLGAKYKVDGYTLQRIVSTGNIIDLKPKDTGIKKPKFSHSPTEVEKQEMKDYLRSKSIYIATPAYGGMMAVNYVNSLTSLMNMCINWGIRYETSFLYNESLITRARNTMVSRFLNESSATDFFFIDADIGFDPNDLIALLAYDEDIICAPCVRKNLRLDRVQKAIKDKLQNEVRKLDQKKKYSTDEFLHILNGGTKEYSVGEMQSLLGEYVLNFPPDNAPKEIDLGKLLEVQHAGTGLMRIKREAFLKFSNFHKEGRWHLPMRGEQENNPVYMYFQSQIDPASARFNEGGLPHYVSEDYSFCLGAREAGMKVYIAPFMVTTHLGQYLFEGNMRSVALAGGSLR